MGSGRWIWLAPKYPYEESCSCDCGKREREADFKEIEEFCKSCDLCVKECKGVSVYEEPIKKDSGIITHIDRSKCINSILENNYCSYCLKICPQGIPD